MAATLAPKAIHATAPSQLVLDAHFLRPEKYHIGKNSITLLVFHFIVHFLFYFYRVGLGMGGGGMHGLAMPCGKVFHLLFGGGGLKLTKDDLLHKSVNAESLIPYFLAGIILGESFSMWMKFH